MKFDVLMAAMYEARRRVGCDSVYLIEVNLRYKENLCHHQLGRWMSTLMKEAASFYESSAHFYQTTRRHNHKT
jgi:hypothetical protein